MYYKRNKKAEQIRTTANKRSYAIGVLVVYQAFQRLSRFVTGTS